MIYNAINIRDIAGISGNNKDKKTLIIIAMITIFHIVSSFCIEGNRMCNKVNLLE